MKKGVKRGILEKETNVEVRPILYSMTNHIFLITLQFSILSPKRITSCLLMEPESKSQNLGNLDQNLESRDQNLRGTSRPLNNHAHTKLISQIPSSPIVPTSLRDPTYV